jgi:hypothetical protein
MINTELRKHSKWETSLVTIEQGKTIGSGKKIKALWYGPFEVLEKVGDNAYRLSLPPYMHIYSVVNVENLKLYEPSMLDQETEEQGPTYHRGLSTRSSRKSW